MEHLNLVAPLGIEPRSRMRSHRISACCVYLISPQSVFGAGSGKWHSGVLPMNYTRIWWEMEELNLLRILVRSGTKITLSLSDFQGPTGVHQTAQEPRCFTRTTPLSPVKPIPGGSSLTKKRQLFPGLLPASPSSFALPHWTQKGRSPCPGSGMLTRFPFNSKWACTPMLAWQCPTSERISPIF